MKFALGSEELICLGKLKIYIDKQRYAKYSSFAGSISGNSSQASKLQYVEIHFSVVCNMQILRF